MSQWMTVNTMLAAVCLLPIRGHRFIPTNESIVDALSLTCNSTGVISRGLVEQGISCSRDEECRGFLGYTAEKGVEMTCKCMSEPGLGNEFTTTFTEHLSLLYSDSFRKGRMGFYQSWYHHCIALGVQSWKQSEHSEHLVSTIPAIDPMTKAVCL